jgi:hypothetical protein
MREGRVTETELMLNRVVGNTELGGGSKLKKGKGFLKPNLELGPNPNLLVRITKGNTRT